MHDSRLYSHLSEKRAAVFVVVVAAGVVVAVDFDQCLA